jgi:hypothetical protein
VLRPWASAKFDSFIVRPGQRILLQPRNFLRSGRYFFQPQEWHTVGNSKRNAL